MDTARNTENKAIAETILTQLGGRRFLAMTGARNLTYGDRALTCRLPIGKARFLSVELNCWDTYDVSVFRANGDICGTLANVYADQLRAAVENLTGLALAL
jgi:hypothetical protein